MKKVDQQRLMSVFRIFLLTWSLICSSRESRAGLVCNAGARKLAESVFAEISAALESRLSKLSSTNSPLEKDAIVDSYLDLIKTVKKTSFEPGNSKKSMGDNRLVVKSGKDGQDPKVSFAPKGSFEDVAFGADDRVRARYSDKLIEALGKKLKGKNVCR